MKPTGRPRGRKRSTAKLFIIKVLLENSAGLGSGKIKPFLFEELKICSPKAVYPHFDDLIRMGLIDKKDGGAYYVPELKNIREKEAYCDRLREELDLSDSNYKKDILKLLGLQDAYFKKGLFLQPKRTPSLIDILSAQAEEQFYIAMDHLIQIYEVPSVKKQGSGIVRADIEDIDRLLCQLPKKTRARYLLEHTKQLLEMREAGGFNTPGFL